MFHRGREDARHDIEGLPGLSRLLKMWMMRDAMGNERKQGVRSDQEFERRLWLSSVPLLKLSKDHLPTNTASGCLIDYGGKRILLTVSHATGDQGNWAIQKRFVQGQGTEVHQLGAMNFLAKASVSNAGIEDVDFSYVEVPSDLQAFRQEIEAPANVVKSETAVTVHKPTLEDEPRSDDSFGFCGLVMTTSEEHFGNRYLAGEFRVYHGLSFLRTEDDYHIFSLPFPHPGHEHFKGCSGAPILRKSGSLVALVCSGDAGNGEIRGISVKAYKAPIDILVGNIQ